MPDHRRTPWVLPLVMVLICLMIYLARPAPAIAGATISSDVISAAGDTARSSSYMLHDTFGQGPIGPVATDTNIQLYDGFWSTLAIAPADTQPPDPVVSFEVMALDEELFLEWTNPSDSDFAGTVIRFSETGFPGAPDEGAPVWQAEGEFWGAPGSDSNYSHVSLTNGTTYYYSAFAFDHSKNYSTALTDSGTPFDGVPPGGVTLGTQTAGDMQVTLRWTNPTDSDFHHTLVRFATDAFPDGPGDGSPVPNGNEGKFLNSAASADSFAHTGLVNGTTYYYSWFAADEVPNYSIPQKTSVTPADTYPPGGVTSAAAIARADGSVKLWWNNPADDDFVGVLVRYSVDHQPASISDGAAVENGADGKFPGPAAVIDSFIHTGLASDTTHYYSLFAYDEVPNYSGRMAVWARPHDETPPELSLSVFQNPYLTSYLDIHLVGKETLQDTSVYCTVGGDEVDMDLADADENVYSGDYELSATGTDTVYARARDVSGNLSEVTHEFTSSLILMASGGTARSADGSVVLEVPPGTFKSDAFVLISEKSPGTPEVAKAYKISPTGLSINGYVEISMAYSEAMGAPEHLAIARLEGDILAPVDSYRDEEGRRILAYVNRLGAYGLVWKPDISTPVYGEGDLVVLQNVPNPFAGSTRIVYELPRVGHVRADVITIDGRLVSELYDGRMIPGRHAIVWNGQDANGQKVASGVYFYRVQFDTKTITRKMVHLR